MAPNSCQGRLSLKPIAAAILLLCLLEASTASTGRQCIRREKPYYDCNREQRKGVFFAHPDDCTYLVACLGFQHFVVSLCSETDYHNINNPQYTLGCPQKCEDAPECYDQEPPEVMEPGYETEAEEDPSKLICGRIGFISNPQECTKAAMCTAVGEPAVTFDICNNVSHDSTFPVGCPDQCPNWKPGVVSDVDSVRTALKA